MFGISIFQYSKNCAYVAGLLLVCGSRLSAGGWFAARFAARGWRLAAGLRLGLRLAAGGYLSAWFAVRGSRLAAGLRLGLRLAARGWRLVCGLVRGSRLSARGWWLAFGSACGSRLAACGWLSARLSARGSRLVAGLWFDCCEFLKMVFTNNYRQSQKKIHIQSWRLAIVSFYRSKILRLPPP